MRIFYGCVKFKLSESRHDIPSKARVHYQNGATSQGLVKDWDKIRQNPWNQEINMNHLTNISFAQTFRPIDPLSGRFGAQMAERTMPQDTWTWYDLVMLIQSFAESSLNLPEANTISTPYIHHTPIIPIYSKYTVLFILFCGSLILTHTLYLPVPILHLSPLSHWKLLHLWALLHNS